MSGMPGIHPYYQSNVQANTFQPQGSRSNTPLSKAAQSYTPTQSSQQFHPASQQYQPAPNYPLHQSSLPPVVLQAFHYFQQQQFPTGYPQQQVNPYQNVGHPGYSNTPVRAMYLPPQQNPPTSSASQSANNHPAGSAGTAAGTGPLFKGPNYASSSSSYHASPAHSNRASPAPSVFGTASEASYEMQFDNGSSFLRDSQTPSHMGSPMPSHMGSPTPSGFEGSFYQDSSEELTIEERHARGPYCITCGQPESEIKKGTQEAHRIKDQQANAVQPKKESASAKTARIMRDHFCLCCGDNRVLYEEDPGSHFLEHMQKKIAENPDAIKFFNKQPSPMQISLACNYLHWIRCQPPKLLPVTQEAKNIASKEELNKLAAIISELRKEQ